MFETIFNSVYWIIFAVVGVISCVYGIKHGYCDGKSDISTVEKVDEYFWEVYEG